VYWVASFDEAARELPDSGFVEAKSAKILAEKAK
jgi:hypothetical protein